MAPRPKKHFWRRCRIYFRRFRIAVWLVILAALGTLVYLNQVGLPNFIKQPLLDKLRERGLDLHFSRLRLRWYQGIVADNVSFGRADDPLGPRLEVAEIRVLLDFQALRHFRLQVQALALRQGRLTWTLAETNGPPRELSVEGIQTYLRFLPNDQWALDDFQARFAGANLRLTGLVTHASAVRDWKFLRSPAPGSEAANAWPNRLRQLDHLLGRLQFATTPELRFDVSGDALEPRSFRARLLLADLSAQTPWGAVAQGRLTARLFPADSNGLSRAQLRLDADEAQSRWGALSNLGLGLELTAREGQTNLVDGDLRLWTRQFQTPWGEGRNLLLTARWMHTLTNPIPLSGSGQLQCDFAQTRWGSVRQFQIGGHFGVLPPGDLPAVDPSWGWWTNLQPYRLDWACSAASVQAPQLEAEALSCLGGWRGPRLAVTNLQAHLYGGQLALQAGLDVATRALQVHLVSDVDPHKLGPMLSEGGRRFLEPYSWQHSPKVKADVAVVLPAWTSRQPDWRAEVQPTLVLRGEFNLNQGLAYQQIPFATAYSHFLYSNLCWHLPDLRLTRPEGTVAAEHRANDRTREFYWRLTSTLDPQLVRPLLDEAQQRAFGFFTLSEPPFVEAEIRGRFHEHETIGIRARVAVSNFTFRGQSFSGLQTRLEYTNHLLQVFEPRVQCGSRQMSADGLTADFDAGLVYLTNGLSTVEPLVVARAIGPHIVRAIEPYRFLQPPRAHVWGTIPMRGEADADLYFDLDGGPFHWWKFNLPHIAGQVHWAGLKLALNQLRADFYGGQANGSAHFDFPPGRPAEFQFGVTVTNVLLHALMADLSTQTNSLEGWLGGAVKVTKANTDDWKSVFGSGALSLRDGLIWEIPLFGIFSPVLNGISPGLGNSRANGGDCTFSMTNGVIRSDDLQIYSTGMRLKYHGTVDLQSRVKARVEAELLRDMWVVGPLVSKFLWPVTKLFEYQVTGTLGDPKSEPVFLLPKLVLLPLHPLRTLKNLVPEPAAPPGTNTFSPPPP